MPKQKFQVKLEKDTHSEATSFVVPFGVQKVFGTRAQVKVRGTINGYPFRTSIAQMGGGKHYMVVNKQVREGARVKGGDVIDVVMEIDTEERTVTIPLEFKQALEKAGVKEMFDKTSYTNRKEYVRWIESAKKPETRVSRIERAVERISKGIKFS